MVMAGEAAGRMAIARRRRRRQLAAAAVTHGAKRLAAPAGF
jgi:hypothetical protein